MHKDDQMTPNERLAAFFAGKEIDRLPAMPFVVTVAGKVCGMTHREKRSSAENQAGCQIGCYEKFGHDGLTVEWGLHGLAMSFGSETNDPEDAVPAVVKYAIDGWDQLDQLDLDKVTKHPWYQLNLDALKICVDKMGNEVGTNISFPGPFTSASDIISIGKLLRGDVIDEVKLDLRRCYDSPCGYIVSTGCDIPLNGPLENIDAFMSAVRTYAKYPLDPNNFAE